MAKLLYIEDNEMNRDMLSRRLSRRGYEIIMAFDGQAGLEMMRSESPDLVLMDMGPVSYTHLTLPTKRIV